MLYDTCVIQHVTSEDMHEFRRRNDPPSILLLDVILTHVCSALHEKLMNISVERVPFC